MDRSRFEALFYAGNYQAVVQQLDNASAKIKSEDLAIAVGAFAFVGRTGEAKSIYNRLVVSRFVSGQIKARFFLALAYTRLSEYDVAKKYFLINFRLRKQNISAEDQFFIFQGVGFYLYYSGQFKKASAWADRAGQAAFKAEFSYGQALATDLRAHISIQIGEVPKGLKLLTQARVLALSLGDGGLPQSIQTQILIYKAQFGFDPDNSIRLLERNLKTLQRNDTFSQSGVLLELARQFTLRGKATQTLLALDQASELIYGHENRRHEVTLNMRYAHVMFLAGDLRRALGFIRSAHRCLNQKVDQALLIQLLGLEYKILERLSSPDRATAVEKRILLLSARFNYGVSRRIRSRRNQDSETASPSRRGEDRLADLLDDLKEKSELSLEALIASQYYGFLIESLKPDATVPTLYLNLTSGSITLIYQANVKFYSGLTPLLTRILLSLSIRPISKEKLIRTIWGYEYDSLRHDNVVYAAMASLRHVLQESAYYLSTEEDGYRWSTDLKIIDKSISTERVPASQMAQSLPVNHALAPHSVSLNRRQIFILDFLKHRRFVDVAFCRGKFEVSDLTASRDLSQLTKLGYLVRVGKARATAYQLAEIQRNK